MHHTENDFITAFWQLYASTPVEKISVSRLCQAAGYNRATFYNHFGNIYDLLDKAVDRIFEPVKSRILSIGDFRTLLEGNTVGTILMSSFMQHDRYIELLFQRKDYSLLGDKLKTALLLLIGNSFSDDPEALARIKILIEYQISAVLGVIRYWYQQNKPIPEQTLLNEIYRISSNGVLPSLKAEIAGNKVLRKKSPAEI